MHRSFDPSDFSMESYIQLLGNITSNGYAVVNFSNVGTDRKQLVLRHDIDFDLAAAANLASLEQYHGYSATYFVMLSSEFYNPSSKLGRESLAAILSRGHLIGLHFDTSIYHGDAAALFEAAENECRVLEQLTAHEVTVISMHRPPPDLVGENINFAGRLNTYAPRFTKEMGYCSDSRGAWHHGSPLENDAYKAGKSLQLLTHPIWWTQESPASPEQSIINFLRGRQDFLSREAERNCKVHSHVATDP